MPRETFHDRTLTMKQTTVLVSTKVTQLASLSANYNVTRERRAAQAPVPQTHY